MQRLRLPLMIIAPIVLIVIGLYAWLTSGRYESTEDAYVQASRVQISANISGRVIELRVHENQMVKAGDVLFRLDPRDYDAAIASARAALETARLQVRSGQAGYEPRAAELRAAQSELTFRQKELDRQRELSAGGVGSDRELSERMHDLSVARDRVATARANLNQTVVTIGGAANAPVETQPVVQEAKAALDRAILNRSYTTVVAAQDGVVTRVEQLQVGSYINAAQPLFSLVTPRMWIEANFKENQLTHMRVGQRGEAEIDAYPGEKFPVHVESLSPGTGSSFSILPPENATGNWVKVTQRLPVRIAFDDLAAVGQRLHAGLSVTVTIDTEHRRSLFGGSAPAERPR